MRYSRKYIAFSLAMIFVIILKMNNWSDDYADVEPFRGAQLEDEVFYPLKAKSINDSGLFVVNVGDQVYGISDGVMMGDSMEPMVSLRFVEEHFGCSAHMYGEALIKVLYSGNTALFSVDTYEATIDGELRPIDIAPEIHEGQGYLPLKVVCDLFGCDYSYDEVNYTATMGTDFNKGELPTAFDLRKEGRVSAVRDQGDTSTCWAQAAIGALESSLLPEIEDEFSVNKMIKDNNYKIDSSLGGDYTMAVAYLLSWKGPANDEDDNVDYHVQEVHCYTQDDIDDIKWAVYKYGGVSTSIYASMAQNNIAKSDYYKKSTNSYYYNGNDKPNHDVVIIGWDDNYSGNNFNENVPGDGAFICQNSWGESFGDNGVFYVSYYDTNVGNQAVSYVGVESKDNYDTIYQSDLCGWVGQVGYNKDYISAANIYTADADENIMSAGFYALDKDTSYTLYFVPEYNGVSSLANRVQVATGHFDNAGYYTVPFDSAKAVKKGTRFAVVLVLTTPGATHPMAIEYVGNEFTQNVDITDGTGYISSNGLDWESVEDTAKGNLCLKAYGKKIEESK
ncbi:MAG: cell surface protein [Lachnospiraceae bacterium]|nr:cell surface protein [Lachnospiraceae bacterium]